MLIDGDILHDVGEALGEDADGEDELGGFGVEDQGGGAEDSLAADREGGLPFAGAKLRGDLVAVLEAGNRDRRGATVTLAAEDVNVDGGGGGFLSNFGVGGTESRGTGKRRTASKAGGSRTTGSRGGRGSTSGRPGRR